MFNKQKSTHREVRLVNLHLDREPDGCFECILRCAECYPCADTHQLYTDSEALISWN